MQTKGEYRVGTKFNPSQESVVDEIKQKTAELIDMIDGIPVCHGALKTAEIMRLKALAQTAYEEAAMWAVKAATKPEPMGE